MKSYKCFQQRLKLLWLVLTSGLFFLTQVLCISKLWENFMQLLNKTYVF